MSHFLIPVPKSVLYDNSKPNYWNQLRVESLMHDSLVLPVLSNSNRPPMKFHDRLDEN